MGKYLYVNKSRIITLPDIAKFKKTKLKDFDYQQCVMLKNKKLRKKLDWYCHPVLYTISTTNKLQ